ncbi:hypothetical protein NM208_g3175 [Fusarium decemcellulare]|uniref:Uncharacterized protein n=1 Tax=Fusarium decemcellulare TaxID=57161 RepID=A0ACC1SQ39_9HYPO|nr:hypothetical protein NM208_g3175 [Fusarium decemcellulare]
MLGLRQAKTVAAADAARMNSKAAHDETNCDGNGFDSHRSRRYVIFLEAYIMPGTSDGARSVAMARLSSCYGSGVDQILGAKIVNVQGQTQTADEELLVGIRGGGGSLGIITELTIKVYSLDKQQTILITGVSGHIGFRVLTKALADGYRVRAVLRKESQIAKIQAVASIQPYLSQLELVLIPDVTVPSAFDAVVDGLWAIIHVASPTFSGFGEVNVSEFCSASWRVTQSVLHFAAKTPSVKRVVITSSISAIIPFFDTEQHDSPDFYTNKSPIRVDGIESWPDHAPENVAYVLSKIFVADCVRKYVQSTQLKVHFSVVNVLPGTTVGPNELASNPRELLAGSNMVAIGPLLGAKFAPIPSIVSHVDDVAFAHLKALYVDTSPGEISSLLPVYNSKADPTPFKWDDAVKIVQEEFPEATKCGIFPFGGTVPVVRLLADSTEDEKMLGRRFKGYREAVIDVVRQYLKLAAK